MYQSWMQFEYFGILFEKRRLATYCSDSSMRMLIMFSKSVVRRRSVDCFVFYYVVIINYYRSGGAMVAYWTHNPMTRFESDDCNQGQPSFQYNTKHACGRLIFLFAICDWIACLWFLSPEFLFIEKCINIWQPGVDILFDGRDPTKECKMCGMLHRVAKTVNILNKRYTLKSN